MRTPCRACQSESWHTKRTWVDHDILTDCCSDCSSFVPTHVHDVYFDKPGEHHGIYDTMGKPVFVATKAQKAYEMKKRGLREAGDRVHGATSFDPISHRHAMKSLERRTS